MRTYKVQRDKENRLVIDGFVTYQELEKIKEKLERMGYKKDDYSKLPIRKKLEVNIW